MLTLVLETCTEKSIVALVENNHCLYMTGLPLGLHHSRFLLPKVEEGFRATNKRPHDLDSITVGVGPGTYTGIRAGAAVAKAMSFAKCIPLIGICTLEGFIPSEDGRFTAIIDAKMAGIYFLKGRQEEGSINYLSEPKVSPLDHLDFTDGEMLIAPSLKTLQEKLKPVLKNSECKWKETAPNPIHLANRARIKLEQGIYSLDGSLQLLYIRE